MFRSATLKLTGWYLLILMLLSLTFSIFIYQVANNEVRARLEMFQNNLQESRQNFLPPPIGAETMRAREGERAATNLSIELLYINVFVLVAGGFISYFLARRSIMPIEKAHEAQSRFTSDASHELRTPLAAMKTELELALSEESVTKSDLRKVLSSNLEEVDKLSRLSEMLLSLSKIDSKNLKFGPVNLNKITTTAIKEFKQPKTRINISSTKHIVIKGDETAISELIRILLDNALQYSFSNLPIKISISKINNSAEFKITNDGQGIDSDKLPYIFDRFYRADSSRTNGTKKGYGLGLALAMNIVKLHHGTITVDSTPSKKTTFTFQLPLNYEL